MRRGRQVRGDEATPRRRRPRRSLSLATVLAVGSLLLLAVPASADQQEKGTAGTATSSGDPAHWEFAGEAKDSNGVCATTNTANATLDLQNFGFSIPAGASIDGIKVETKFARDGGAGGTVHVLKPDGTGGVTVSSTSFSAVDTADSCEGTHFATSQAPEEWGTAKWFPANNPWAAEDINHSTFGVRVSSGSVGADPRYLDAVRVTVFYTLDTEPPSVTITFPQDDGVYNNTTWETECGAAQLCGTIEDNSEAASVEYSMRQEATDKCWDDDGVEAFSANCPNFVAAALDDDDWSANFSLPPDGAYTIQVRGHDVAGNTSDIVSHSFVIDDLDPTALIVFPDPDGGGEYGEITWNAGCDDPGFCGTADDGDGVGITGVQFSVRRVADEGPDIFYWDGSTFAGQEQFHDAAGTTAWAASFPFANFSDVEGTYELKVRAEDGAGNVGADVMSRFMIVAPDEDPPTVEVDFPANSASYSRAGWNPGCAAGPGMCGTMSDATVAGSESSGIQSVRYSLRSGTNGPYWDGTAFTSGEERLHAASMGDGTWHVPFPQVYFPSGGSYVFRAIATDNAGLDSSPVSRTFTIVESTSPARPVILSPSNQAGFNGAVLISGTADPGSLVKVYVVANPTPVAIATADGSGDWSVTRSFHDGTHTIVAAAKEASGDESGPSSSVTFHVDTAAPRAPVIFFPAEGEIVLNAEVTIAGTAESGALVSVREGTEVIGTAAASSGNWSITATFVEGPHTIQATATDGFGNTSPAAVRSFTVEVDDTPPAKPVIAHPVAGSLHGPEVTIEGTAEPESAIVVREGAAIVARATTTGNGQWTVAVSMTDGPHEIQATAEDRAGNVSEPSDPVSFSVDARRPDVTIDTPDGNVFLPTDSFTFQGTATDDRSVSHVEVHVVNLLGTRVADLEVVVEPEGGTETTWSATVEGLLPGRYTVAAYAVDAKGNRSSAATANYIVLVV